MDNGSDSEDDRPLVFKRSTPSVKQNQVKPDVKKTSMQKPDSKSGRQMSDVRSPNGNGHDSNIQKGKTVPSTKGSPVLSPLASPKASSSSKGSQVKPPVASTKASTSGGDKSRQNIPQNKNATAKADKPSGKLKDEPHSCSEDSDDDKPLNSRLPVGGSKGSITELNKRPGSSGPASLAKPDVGVKEEDSEDDIPLSHKFKQKSNAGQSSNAYDSDDVKPFASKHQQNGTSARDNVKNPSTALNKRPSAEVKCSGQSPVKKAKHTATSTPVNGKKVSVKAEPKKEDDDSDDDNATISQRVKKPVTPISKTSDKKKAVVSVSSSLNKVNKSSKKITKTTQFSKSLKVPPGSGEGQKWTTLVHNGVIFPPPYKPHGVKMLYKGKPVDLTPEQEEVATMIAVMQDTEYMTKPVFRENVMNDWKKILGRNHIIKSLDDCDFTPIYEWHQSEKEKKKQMSAEEKKAVKEEKMKQEEKYMWAIVDGVKEKVGNFRVEPPGLFRGRGEHPKMGKLKKRIYPSDITINIGNDAPIPECPIPGESWKEVRHDNTVTWLAYWLDPINGKEFKYVFLAASSALKGQSDKEKYEKARKLKGYIAGIRTAYTKDFANKDVAKRQIAVATYLIDKLALRAGNEKDDDEADTVGCCTLKVENVEPSPPNILKLDFLGKDSIRYQNEVEVEIPVFKAIQQFRSGKEGSDNLFDKLDTTKLNAHLKELMPGLSAKVFRTYNASITLDEMLNKETKGGDVSQKVAVYQHANKEVAIICNHQCSVSKSHSTQMLRLYEKINELKDLVEELKTDLSRAKKGKPPLKGSDGKTKRNINPEALEKKIAQTNAKIEKMERDKEIKEDLKTVALGTSKINYLDPRITVAWCKRYEVPIEKVIFWLATCLVFFQKKAFASGNNSAGVTSACELHTTVLEDDRVLKVIDTPGLFNATVDNKYIGEEIVNCVNMAKDGIHAVLVVLSVWKPFTEEQAAAISSLWTLFGKKIADHMIVIFTGGDELEFSGKTLKEYVGDSEALKELLHQCEDRWVVFNNRTRDQWKKDEQVEDLLSLVNLVVAKNGGKPYMDELSVELKKEARKLHDQTEEVSDPENQHELFLKLKQEARELHDQTKVISDQENHNELSVELLLEDGEEGQR